jgi:23S rRNA (guanosine2251-2'-O)-methyltransferase
MKGKNRTARNHDADAPARAGGNGDRPRHGRPDHRAPRPAPRQPERAAPPAQPRQGGHGIWLYGIHPVLAALANPRRRCHRLLLTPETEGSLGARLESLADRRPGGLRQAEIVSREQLEKLVPRGAVHQGIAIHVDGLEDADIEDICRATEDQSSARIVVLDQVTDPHNVGAVLRSAAAFAAAAVVLPERHSPAAQGTLAKAASGAMETVPLVRVVNLARALDRLKQAGFWCVGLDGTAQQAIHEADLSGKVALVLGAEGEGLRRLTREHCDLMVRIPIAKGMESLNVSNAAAVALYELVRRT